MVCRKKKRALPPRSSDDGHTGKGADDGADRPKRAGLFRCVGLPRRRTGRGRSQRCGCRARRGAGRDGRRADRWQAEICRRRGRAARADGARGNAAPASAGLCGQGRGRICAAGGGLRHPKGRTHARGNAGALSARRRRCAAGTAGALLRGHRVAGSICGKGQRTCSFRRRHRRGAAQRRALWRGGECEGQYPPDA